MNYIPENEIRELLIENNVKILLVKKVVEKISKMRVEHIM